MQTPKKKKTQPQLNRWSFTVLLTAFGAATWAFFITLFMAVDSTGSIQENLIGWLLMVGLFPALLLVPVQHILLKRRLGRALNGWFPVSVLGWLLGALVFWIARPLDEALYLILLWFMPVFVLQARVLRRISKQSWLWVIAGLASTLVFLRSGTDTETSLFAWGLAGGAQGFISALVLLWLQRDGTLKGTQSQVAQHEHATDTENYLEDVNPQADDVASRVGQAIYLHQRGR